MTILPWRRTFVVPSFFALLLLAGCADSGGTPVSPGAEAGGSRGEPARSADARSDGSAHREHDVELLARKHPKAPAPANLPALFEQEVPGTAERECVYVNRLLVETGGGGAIRSGEFVAGPFTYFVRGWVPYNENKLWFAPLHTQKMSKLVVRAIPLAHPEKARTILYKTIAWEAEAPPDSKEAMDTRFYPGAMRLPEAGRWRLIANSGPDWGCFEVTVGEEGDEAHG